jgi:hypothetical protein
MGSARYDRLGNHRRRVEPEDHAGGLTQGRPDLFCDYVDPPRTHPVPAADRKPKLRNRIKQLSRRPWRWNLSRPIDS